MKACLARTRRKRDVFRGERRMRTVESKTDQDELQDNLDKENKQEIGLTHVWRKELKGGRCVWQGFG